MLSEQTIEQVRQYPDIVAIISPYVTLKKRGRNFIGLCPFHSEKSPSFTVSPEKQLWHCFGCQESGDHIGFLMKIENISFADSIIHIANKAGIPVVETQKSELASERDIRRAEHLDILFQVRDYFESLFDQSPGAPYLEKRGFARDVLKRFHAGFSGASSDLMAYARTQNWDTTLLEQVGVLGHSESGDLYSRFRNRVMFPILDIRGRAVGFGGRTLESTTTAAKYINTDETLLFNKRKLLYGLDQAKSAIQKQGSLLLMEGYLDVIAAHQFGFTHAVGTMGTALSYEQAQLIQRLASKVYLIFDSDRAGQLAIDRSYEVLKAHHLQVMVVSLNSKDPADFLMENGTDAFTARLDQAIPILEYCILQVAAQWTGHIEDVPGLLDTIFPLLQKETDPLIQHHYVTLLSTTFNLQPELVVAKLKNFYYNFSEHFSPKVERRDKYQKAQEFLVFWMASSLAIRKQLLSELELSVFNGDFLKIVEHMSRSICINKELVVDIPDTKSAGILSQILLNGEEEYGAFQSHLTDNIRTLRTVKTQGQILDIKSRLKQAEAIGDDGTVTELLTTLQSLLSS